MLKSIKLKDLVPFEKNPRINEKAVDRVLESLKFNGYVSPIVVNEIGYPFEQHVIAAGHTRWKALQKFGTKEAEVFVYKFDSEKHFVRYNIEDNKAGEFAEWDEAMLAELAGEFEVDLGEMGFEFDGMEETNEGLTDEDEVPEAPVEPVAKLGQMWKLGEHRLMCGDSTDRGQVERLMGGEKADMVFTDPPYGISIVKGKKVGGDAPFGSKSKRGTVGASNVVKCNNYAEVEGDGDISVALKAIEIIKELSIDVQIIWGGNYYANALDNSSCWIVWDKQNSGNFADCELAWTNQKTAVRMFSHMWNGMVKASEHGQKRVHPTQKPIALADWCFDEYGKECSSVLDLFGGSGSTLMACESKGKRCFMMEFSPAYIDVIIKRWEDFTGKKAELIES